ncbi:Enoyl-CoA hydratase/carnithine racemase [Seinonella peptonophila]|uniref:Enoyl-CoA hydratase/carnithine racemase n=1 Tax=Seinonella peptonophila TaxID=112248 RepID=A0A1M4SKG5_9BACL|nr:enoyl-CoA hydratase/isomerase family protein [Seinonella peptonophila]SHE32691.1 Enoyl-CoA hydratase/carnithine racemase [Seinonella peptonophila]
MQFQHIIYQISNNVLTITLNRESTYNALSTDTKLELQQAFQQGEQDQSVKAIVVTGAGERSFCSGQDLSESKELTEELAQEWVNEFDQLYRVIRSVQKPIIASINGYAVGSGLQLAMLADIRIGVASAKFAMTEINVGLACIIGTTMFWEIMGRSRTTDLILSGRMLTAEEAEQYGLITRLVPDHTTLKEETTKLAFELAAKPPVALSSNKKWFNYLTEENFNHCMDFAREAHKIGYASGEPQEMMRKFFAK